MFDLINWWLSSFLRQLQDLPLEFSLIIKTGYPAIFQEAIQDIFKR